MLSGMPRSRHAISAIVAILVGACAATPSATAPSASPGGSAPSTATASAAAPSASSSEPAPTPAPLAWAALEADGPAAREDHTWTLDDTGEVAYLFGGRDGTTVFDDTWAFRVTDDSWTQLAPATAPPGRFGHEAVWVDGVGLVVFAGQADPQTFFNDLWAYDPVADAWAQLAATGASPVARYGTCAAVGPDGRLWISHGFTEEQSRFSDTRAYDFATGSWTDETPAAGARPVERCLHGCWWTDAGELALYAGQTTGVVALDDRWTLSDGAWSLVEGDLPPARNLYARARQGAGTIVFGGLALDGSYLDDLWLLADDAIDARALEPAGGPPPARAGAELIVDATRGRALLFGGRGGDGALDDLWILSGV
jgi:galactose oxidase-like protein